MINIDNSSFLEARNFKYRITVLFTCPRQAVTVTATFTAH